MFKIWIINYLAWFSWNVEWEYLFSDSNSNDTSWNWYNGTDTDISYVTGIVSDKAMSLNGTTSHSEIQWLVDWNVDPSIKYNIVKDFSVWCWIKVDKITWIQSILQVHSYIPSTTTWRGFVFRLNNDELSAVIVAWGNDNSLLTTNAMNLAVWTEYFVCFTRSWATATFYMGTKWWDDLQTFAYTNTNKTLDNSNIDWTEPTPAANASTISIWIEWINAWDFNHFDWLIDDLRVSNTGWSLSEVEELYAPWK